MPDAGRAPSKDFVPDVELALMATRAEVQLMAGKPTRVFTYQAQVLKGSAESAVALPNSPLGPVIRVKQGQKVRINFTNSLPGKDDASVIHWHGLMLPEDMDGHPRFAIAPGQSYAYEFEVVNRAGTYWFHPHPHGQTARQVYNGLAGMFIVSDAEEAALGLPSDEFDVPLIVQDRTFDKNNQLAYFGQGMMAGAMETLMGFRGEKVVMNGQPDYKLEVSKRAYRLRVLNGSNARIYKLAWGDGTPLTVIGTDGGLLEKPITREFAMLAPGERIELWADFSDHVLGNEVTLESLAFAGAEDPAEEMKGMMGSSSAMTKTQSMSGMGAGTAPSTQPDTRLGAPMTLVTIRVTKEANESPKLPKTLAKPSFYTVASAINTDQPRTFELKQKNMQWFINGRQWEMDKAAADETVKADTLEVWEIVNAISPGEQMHTLGMAHPFHIHGVQFQVLERKLLDDKLLKLAYATVSDGYVNEGWKDTVMLMPGERAKLLIKFGKHTGLFAYHCHNLEHEDMGMMRNYKVVA